MAVGRGTSVAGAKAAAGVEIDAEYPPPLSELNEAKDTARAAIAAAQLAETRARTAERALEGVRDEVNRAQSHGWFAERAFDAYVRLAERNAFLESRLRAKDDGE